MISRNPTRVVGVHAGIPVGSRAIGRMVRDSTHHTSLPVGDDPLEAPLPDASAFTGTNRGLFRSVLGPWSPVPKCEAPGAPNSVEEHTSMAPRPHRQSQNPPLQKSSAIPVLTVAFKTTFEVFTRVGPDNSLERLTEGSV
jgi:hypothetical protein